MDDRKNTVIGASVGITHISNFYLQVQTRMVPSTDDVNMQVFVG